jgi:hypothetical protein
MSIYQFILSMILASDISVARPRRRLPIRKFLGWRHEPHSGRGCLPSKGGARKRPIRLYVERMPSFAPSTAARSQPMRPVRSRSFLIGEPPSHETPPSFGAPVLGFPASAAGIRDNACSPSKLWQNARSWKLGLSFFSLSARALIESNSPSL